MSSGRVEHYVPAHLKEEEKEEFLGKLLEEEEKSQNIIPRLRTIVEDGDNVFPGKGGGEEGEEDAEKETTDYKFESNFI